ncbi:hypothetical protein PROFUN_14064 [Planoprotostelium fungivorum]|uniref:Uncharacterized protein n=1 Tax=Planoprotostelium fungivorum TaxID=1890364 RepID=A0A2P6N203_9EUKA|nr:hypothetical protein PROFUN_14064 [Planoprotostelium fungivorum]
MLMSCPTMSQHETFSYAEAMSIFTNTATSASDLPTVLELTVLGGQDNLNCLPPWKAEKD